MNSLQKTIFLVAGEPSGDIHGARLVSAMKKGQSNILFVGHGGDEMASVGVTIIEHVNNLSIMGFSEVIQKSLNCCKNQALKKAKRNTYWKKHKFY